MLIKSNANYWFTATHHSSIDKEGFYLPSGVNTSVSDELGAYLITLEGVMEIKEIKEVKETKSNKSL